MFKYEKIIGIVEKQVIFFPDELLRDLANETIFYYHKYNTLNIADFISYLATDETRLKLFNEILNMDIKDKYSDEEIDDYISVINSFPVKKKVNDLDQKMKAETDPLEKAKILSESLSLRGVK